MAELPERDGRSWPASRTASFVHSALQTPRRAVQSRHAERDPVREPVRAADEEQAGHGAGAAAAVEVIGAPRPGRGGLRVAARCTAGRSPVAAVGPAEGELAPSIRESGFFGGVLEEAVPSAGEARAGLVAPWDAGVVGPGAVREARCTGRAVFGAAVSGGLEGEVGAGAGRGGRVDAGADGRGAAGSPEWSPVPRGLVGPAAAGEDAGVAVGAAPGTGRAGARWTCGRAGGVVEGSGVLGASGAERGAVLGVRGGEGLPGFDDGAASGAVAAAGDAPGAVSASLPGAGAGAGAAGELGVDAGSGLRAGVGACPCGGSGTGELPEGRGRFGVGDGCFGFGCA